MYKPSTLSNKYGEPGTNLNIHVSQLGDRYVIPIDTIYTHLDHLLSTSKVYYTTYSNWTGHLFLDTLYSLINRIILLQAAQAKVWRFEY